MKTAEIEEMVISVLAELLRLEAGSVTVDSYLNEQLGVDSTTAIELIFEIEERLNIDISNEDAQSFRQVKDIVGYLESRFTEGQFSGEANGGESHNNPRSSEPR